MTDDSIAYVKTKPGANGHGYGYWGWRFTCPTCSHVSGVYKARSNAEVVRDEHECLPIEITKGDVA